LFSLFAPIYDLDILRDVVSFVVYVHICWALIRQS